MSKISIFSLYYFRMYAKSSNFVQKFLKKEALGLYIKCITFKFFVS